MNDKHNTAASPGVMLADILYVVFRHKWKIALISGAAIAAAVMLPFLVPYRYESEAKLFVKYVVETKSPGQVGMNDPRVTSDEGGSAINTEMEILTSLDLARQVADVIGPEKLMAKASGGTNADAAAALIHRNLISEAPNGSKVIKVTFKHKDRALAQAVLTEVIQAYLKRHEEIHLHVGAFDEFLTQQTDQLRSRLLETEDQLKRAKTNAGIISLEDSKKVYTEEISRIQQAIRDAEADLAERQAAASEMAKLLHTSPPTLTNDVTANTMPAATPEKVAEYRKICRMLDNLSKRQQELLVQFTPQNSWVKQIDEQIAANEKLKQQLETANPSLVAERVGGLKDSAADPGPAMRSTLFTETARAVALQTRIQVLSDQLVKIRKEAGLIDEFEGSITDLQRKRNLQEKNYEYFAANLEQSKIDQALGAGRAYNISVIQAPSPAGIAGGSKLQKMIALVLFGGIACAFGLAYLIEFYLDNSIKRPIEIETKVGLPLFVSIPRLALAAGRHLSKKKTQISLLRERTYESKTSGQQGEVPAALSDGAQAEEAETPWQPLYVLRPFCEALRDGLITFFEVNNLTHKPKLVAVTSCSKGAGASTIAAGLAASLSETGDGNVLLVDMNQKNGSVHQFYKGDLTCGLDDALETASRGSALVQGKLYLATESSNGSQLPVVLPTRFKNLLPRLRASDYDYIIFDMPAIGQISPTQRLARFMDMVVMVVESEKTDRQIAKRASSLLAGAKVNVGVVLNKTRHYVPRWLHQEI
jgi:uncharacterized protein involved in exopolysaccharide biosynthesis/Mrp family chromosome partitioning ATPase